MSTDDIGAPNPAAIAYEAYRTSINASGERGEYLIPWDMLPRPDKLAWWAVVPTIEDMDAMRAEHGIESYDAGHFMLMPRCVTCAYCGESFDTEHYDE